jgi:dimethylamine monooxygenase subunit C
MITPKNMELSFRKGKRKFLFCADGEGVSSLYVLVQQAMKENVPFDFHVLDDVTDSFLGQWFDQQKMGTYLYISGRWESVKRVGILALEAGFFEHEMQWKVIDHGRKAVMCCKCHGVNEDGGNSHITCQHCGIRLEVSDHYSRRLEAYLGYVTIK